jgi:hypothetical protein
MLHPSLLNAIGRPRYIRPADWALEFAQECRFSDSDAIDAVHFSARVQRASSINSDGTQALTVMRPTLVFDADRNGTSMEEDARAKVHPRVNVPPAASTASPSDSMPISPYRSSPGSRTSHLLSLRSSTLQQPIGSASTPTKHFEIDEIGPSFASECDVLKAITRLQRQLESDCDGPLLGQLW